MEVEFNPAPDEIQFDNEKDKIIDFLSSNNQIVFKQQQIGEADLNKEQKTEIAVEMYEKSKLGFLTKFGKYLKENHLEHFKQFSDDNECNLLLKQLMEEDKFRSKNVKNRRYEALKQLIKDDEYFTDLEMMKRNPLLYEQLVGQYMSSEEIYERDKYKMDEQATFVKILMEGIDRDKAMEVKKEQEYDELKEKMEDWDYSDEEMSSGSPEPSTSARWGEFDDAKPVIRKAKVKTPMITPEERKLLKEEFITSMYQSFLDGEDEDFDYETIDNNTSYDNLDQIDHDKEDEYFDSEDPETVDIKNEDQSSEDELDIYMSALNDHPAVNQLTTKIKKL
ncbi:unnamed protein product [Brassicogethes aeneus]|uniref:CCD97-like C-terminal domain-containing protein n=1 Tax=Brassicogethes aeneus TaxID=1431903 RepID=A0A9P0BA98_BRAAE|nr:unnamed protein product [Brassicogethes aeneus]